MTDTDWDLLANHDKQACEACWESLDKTVWTRYGSAAYLYGEQCDFCDAEMFGWVCVIPKK